MIASLPMYWRNETADAWRIFWDLVRANCDTPLPDLTSPENLPHDWGVHWSDPGLVLSMTCGFPFRTLLRGRVEYVGTLDFGLGGREGHYRSVVVARPGDLPERVTLAFNSRDSQSGWAVVGDRGEEAPALKIGRAIETGSHEGSLAAVAHGRADVAYLDAVTWRLLDRHDPNARVVRVMGWTSWTPGLPLITAGGRDPVPLRRDLERACHAVSEDVARAVGGLAGFVVLDPADYFAVPDLSPDPALLT